MDEGDVTLSIFAEAVVVGSVFEETNSSLSAVDEAPVVIGIEVT